MTKLERLIQINEELVQRAEIICKLAHPSYSGADKGKNIISDMKKHVGPLEEAIKSLRN